MAPRPGVWENPRLVLAVTVMGGYIAISRGVRHLFPFSIFDMYSTRGESGSRVIARADDGRVTEVDRYRAWECEAPLRVEGDATCPRRGTYVAMDYKDEEALDYIASHRGHEPGAAPVDVIRRITWLSEGSRPARIEDCLIGRCRAVRR